MVLGKHCKRSRLVKLEAFVMELIRRLLAAGTLLFRLNLTLFGVCLALALARLQSGEFIFFFSSVALDAFSENFARYWRYWALEVLVLALRRIFDFMTLVVLHNVLKVDISANFR